MATRAEREKVQRTNDKHKNILAVLLSREENKYCADCLAKGPRWASWNLGVLLCIRCSGLHRSLGVHISKVKSVNLDTWTREQMLNFCCRGNGWAKDTYEARLPRDHKRPQADSSLEYFIRDKYEKKKYIAPVEIPLRPLTGLGLIDENVDSPKKGRSRDGKRDGVSIISIPKPKGLHPTSPGIPRPKSLPQLPKHDANSPVQNRAQNHAPAPTTDDLLGLNSPISKDAPVSVVVNNDAAPPAASADLTEDLFGPMSSFQSLSLTSSVSSPNLLNGGLESSSSNPEPPAAQEKVEDKRLSKDSILSLYSHGTKSSPSSMMPPGNFNIPPQSQMGFQQQQPNMMQYNQQSFPQNMGMQGMPSTYQQQQMMNINQQQMNMNQQQLQMQQMAQQMPGMNMSGMGYGMPPQQQNPMQGNMGYGMGYNQQMFQAQQQQQPYGNNMANGANTGMTQMGAYSAMMPGMQVQPGANTSMWGQANPGMNSGHTLSTQLWK
uniref:stromal membrane-associated protein 1-like n=1 Tax=Styela clava TaxID=7725 RepID=UPI00193A9FD4|nr:stromal membrane-associated protein 1-like [Styela clava]